MSLTQLNHRIVDPVVGFTAWFELQPIAEYRAYENGDWDMWWNVPTLTIRFDNEYEGEYDWYLIEWLAWRDDKLVIDIQPPPHFQDWESPNGSHEFDRYGTLRVNDEDVIIRPIWGKLYERKDELRQDWSW